MDDADRHDQIDALTTLKRILDDDADDADVRDAAIRAVNRFDASIAAHDDWRPYRRRGPGDPSTRAEADELGRQGVEQHRVYRGRLRRSVRGTMMTITIRESRRTGSPTSGDANGTSDRRRRTGGRKPMWAIERANTDIGQVVGRTGRAAHRRGNDGRPVPRDDVNRAAKAPPTDPEPSDSGSGSDGRRPGGEADPAHRTRRPRARAGRETRRG